MWMNLSIGSSVYDICLRAVKTENLLVVELYIRGDKDLYHQLFENRMPLSRNWALRLTGGNFQKRKQAVLC